MLVNREQTIREIKLRREIGVSSRRRRIPRQIAPRMIEMEYARAIISILDQARVEAEMVSRRWLVSRRDSSTSDDFDRLIARFFDRIRPRDAELIAKKFADRTVRFSDENLKRQARAALGIDIFTSERGLSQALEKFSTENVSLIRSVPKKYLDEVEMIVTRAIADGRRWEDVAGELSDRFSVAENRAKLIARDQVGKLYGNIQQIRQEQLGVENYIWRTVHDSRVRHEHAVLDGKRFSWSKPPSDGHPGNAINCRCQADPDFSDLLD